MFFNKQQKLEVVIGCESVIRGEINSKGTVRIDGTLEGGINADCVIIGESGNIAGDAVVRMMVVGGRIAGNIRAEEGIDIQRNGNVCGDIFAARLTIADGGIFDGRSSMQRAKEIPYSGNETITES